jgi:molybdopterin converting factor small subunit
MLARIKLFGPMRQAVGLDELALDVKGDPPTCVELRREIRAAEPRLAGLIDGCRFAVNGRFAAEEQPLAGSDEIALIGFVSGG